ncbi:MAG TPA: NUDIX hydrolase [Trebonia sp.]|jgi:ADP-ribose pyrophosphatase YjhB (NUDIX family)
MGEISATAITKQSARAILIDDEKRLVLFKRTRPGRPVYWTTPGGGVEPTDASLQAALRRELAEELGAEVTGPARVFVHTRPSMSRAGLTVEHYFVARLVKLDLAARTGEEFGDPAHGAYDVERYSLCGTDDVSLAELDLQPAELKQFILTNRALLLAEAASAAAPGFSSGELARP